MLILYVRDGCPFSARVRSALARMNLSCEERNVADPGVVEELTGKGGKRQTPYLVDTEADTEMYESEKIVAHLAKTYGKKQRGLARV